ncbi:MAG TPA: DUF1549 domain-containing protein, partial [Pirellulales bacterium]
MRVVTLCLFTMLFWGVASFADSARGADAPSYLSAAQKVDQTLAVEWGLSGPQTLVAADDETFLRRATLDFAGRLPTPEEVAAFVLDPAVDKRDRFINQMLARPEYGRN